MHDDFTKSCFLTLGELRKFLKSSAEPLRMYQGSSEGGLTRVDGTPRPVSSTTTVQRVAKGRPLCITFWKVRHGAKPAERWEAPKRQPLEASRDSSKLEKLNRSETVDGPKKCNTYRGMPQHLLGKPYYDDDAESTKRRETPSGSSPWKHRFKRPKSQANIIRAWAKPHSS